MKDDKLSDVPFTNIMDKGYHCSSAAWHKGQLVVQPARTDVRFSTDNIISPSAIATDRSGNKQGVNVCKQRNVIKRGLYKSR